MVTGHNVISCKLRRCISYFDCFNVLINLSEVKLSLKSKK